MVGKIHTVHKLLLLTMRQSGCVCVCEFSFSLCLLLLTKPLSPSIEKEKRIPSSSLLSLLTPYFLGFSISSVQTG